MNFLNDIKIPQNISLMKENQIQNDYSNTNYENINDAEINISGTEITDENIYSEIDKNKKIDFNFD